MYLQLVDDQYLYPFIFHTTRPLLALYLHLVAHQYGFTEKIVKFSTMLH